EKFKLHHYRVALEATIPCGGHPYRPHDQRLGSESRPSSSHCFHALCPAPYPVTSPSTTTATNLLVPTSLNWTTWCPSRASCPIGSASRHSVRWPDTPAH